MTIWILMFRGINQQKYQTSSSEAPWHTESIAKERAKELTAMNKGQLIYKAVKFERVKGQ